MIYVVSPFLFAIYIFALNTTDQHHLQYLERLQLLFSCLSVKRVLPRFTISKNIFLFQNQRGVQLPFLPLQSGLLNFFNLKCTKWTGSYIGLFYSAWALKTFLIHPLTQDLFPLCFLLPFKHIYSLMDASESNLGLVYCPVDICRWNQAGIALPTLQVVDDLPSELQLTQDQRQLQAPVTQG